MAGYAVRPIEVLLVEDDEDDVRLTREGLDAGKVVNRLTVLSDGSEVIAYLRGEGGHAGAPRPDFVLLDLNLPGRDGRQVLAEIKADPELRRIPVVVLTGATLPLGSLERHQRSRVIGGEHHCRRHPRGSGRPIA